MRRPRLLTEELNGDLPMLDFERARAIVSEWNGQQTEPLLDDDQPTQGETNEG